MSSSVPKVALGLFVASAIHAVGVGTASMAGKYLKGDPDDERSPWEHFADGMQAAAWVDLYALGLLTTASLTWRHAIC